MAITIGNYERFHPIGSGGYSQVYEAYDKEHARKIAVKVLTLGADSGLDREMFERECQAMGSVSEHPNIVTVYESGFSEEGFPYIAMELYHGTMLDRIKKQGYLPLPDVLEAGVHICGALARSHSQGILHRDIKPQNIFYSTYGDPALGDFGIASISRDPNSEKMAGLTPHYAAPEVLDGNLPVVESDVYSLGATLYTALAGHRPFARAEKDGEAALVNRVMTEPPPPITVQSIPAYAERVLLSFLAKHPNDRPRSAIEAGNLLRDLQARMGIPQTPLRTATVGLDDDLTVSKLGSSTPPTDTSPSSGLSAEESHQSASKPMFEELTAGSVTIARSKTSEAPTSDYQEPEPDNRRWLAAAVLAAVLIVAGIGFALSGGGKDEVQATTSTSAFEAPSTTIIQDLSHPDPPTDLSFKTSAEVVVLAWTADERAVSFRVDYVVGDGDSLTTEEHELTFAPGRVVAGDCVQVTAINASGRTSEPSDAICLQ